MNLAVKSLESIRPSGLGRDVETYSCLSQYDWYRSPTTLDMLFTPTSVNATSSFRCEILPQIFEWLNGSRNDRCMGDNLGDGLAGAVLEHRMVLKCSNDIKTLKDPNVDLTSMDRAYFAVVWTTRAVRAH